MASCSFFFTTSLCNPQQSPGEAAPQQSVSGLMDWTASLSGRTVVQIWAVDMDGSWTWRQHKTSKAGRESGIKSTQSAKSEEMYMCCLAVVHAVKKIYY